MKLRRRNSSHQLLFAAAFGLLAVTTLFAQDKVIKKDKSVMTGKIVGVAGSSLQVQIGAGTIGVPLATVASVVMTVPADFTAGKDAYDTQDYAKALAPIQKIVGKFKGLNTAWAQQAAGMLGDIYVSLNKLTEAEAAYQDYQKIYGGEGSAQTDVGLARISVSKKEFDKAKEKLAPVVAQALKERHPAKAVAGAYSQAFYLMGQIAESQQDYPSALEHYLRTVTLYPADRAAVSGAKERADAIRKEHKTTVP